MKKRVPYLLRNALADFPRMFRVPSIVPLTVPAIFDEMWATSLKGGRSCGVAAGGLVVVAVDIEIF
jgi:hypothetical protein